jgi:small subunit ribosomal protein S15
MSLSHEKTTEIIKKYGHSGSDTGSARVQIALLTERLNQLNDHFKDHVKDHHSRRGLMKLVGKRRRLLDYLSRSNPGEYKTLISDLGLRR